MARRGHLALLGAMWACCGVVIGLSPPVSDSRRAAQLPTAGWLLVVAGMYVIYRVIRDGRSPTASTRPRHDSGREPDTADAIRLIVATGGFLVAGGGFLWWGVAEHLPSIIGFGLVALSGATLLVPHAIRAIRQLLHA